MGSSAQNSSCVPLPGTFSGTFSGTLLNLTWLCTKASQTFSGTLSGTFSTTFSEPCWTWALHQSLLEPSPESSPEPCWTWPGLPDLLRNPVELTWHCTEASQTFSGTFSGTLLNLTWLCTKASQTFSGTFSVTLLNLTWLCTKASQTLTGNFVKPCWTWPGSAPKPPWPSPEPSPEPCWTWPGSAPVSPTFSEAFSGTFSGTLLDLTWLCAKASWNLLQNLLGNPVDPDLALHQSPPGQVQRGSGWGRLWWRASLGLRGFRRRFRKRLREALVQSQVRRRSQRLAWQHASERFLEMKLCGCWGYRGRLFGFDCFKMIQTCGFVPWE